MKNNVCDENIWVLRVVFIYVHAADGSGQSLPRNMIIQHDDHICHRPQVSSVWITDCQGEAIGLLLVPSTLLTNRALISFPCSGVCACKSFIYSYRSTLRYRDRPKLAVMDSEALQCSLVVSTGGLKIVYVGH
jgi:hypothetical protein